MKTYEPNKSLGFLLVEVARLMRADFNERVSELGLTQAQWRALAHLCRSEGCNQAFLAEILEIKPITLTRLLDKLVDKGWVIRRQDINDRRAVNLYLTEEARPLIKVMEKKAIETRMRACSGLSEDEVEQLFSSLGKMKESLIKAG